MSQAIVTAVADAEGVEPTDLSPLYRVVDTDALDELFTSESSEESRTEQRVSFRYEGYEVTVYSSGRVDLDEADPSGNS